MFGRLTVFDTHHGTVDVRCLRCGSARASGLSATSRLEEPECPTCGYLGWCESTESAPPGGADLSPSQAA